MNKLPIIIMLAFGAIGVIFADDLDLGLFASLPLIGSLVYVAIKISESTRLRQNIKEFWKLGVVACRQYKSGGLKGVLQFVHFILRMRPEVRSKTSRVNFPRIWELLGFVLPKKTRNAVYEPYRQELLEDYVRARRYRTAWSRRWLAFAFTVRTILAVLESLRVGLVSAGGRMLLGLVPERWKQWWTGG